MNDPGIISLFFKRDEEALSELKAGYYGLAYGVASRLVGKSDAEEAVNSAMLDVWNSIPPNRPLSLAAYFCSLTRRRAVDMLRSSTRKKRGGTEYDTALEELGDVVPSPVTAESELENRLLREALDEFLGELPEKTRVIFMQRYWWLLPIREIARENGMSESAVKMQLKRTREKLRSYLQKEGFEI